MPACIHGMSPLGACGICTPPEPSLLTGGNGWRINAWRCDCCPEYHNVWRFYTSAPDSHISNADHTGSEIFQSVGELVTAHPRLTPIRVDNEEALLADYLARHGAE
jgi:hypothetical protein